MHSYLNTIWHYCLQREREMSVQPDFIISAETGDCGAVFAVAANWRHFHLLEILLGWDVVCLQDWEWSQFSTLHPHLCVSVASMIFKLALNGMLTSVSNYFSTVWLSQDTDNMHLCMSKQVNRDGAIFELGWTSRCVCVCVCQCLCFMWFLLGL